MEMTAIIEACHFISNYWLNEGESVEILSDSAYVINCYIDKWYKNWENNGWKTANNFPVKNQDLWKEIVPFFNILPNKLIFTKVKGHSNSFENMLADKLATHYMNTEEAVNAYNE